MRQIQEEGKRYQRLERAHETLNERLQTCESEKSAAEARVDDLMGSLEQRRVEAEERMTQLRSKDNEMAVLKKQVSNLEYEGGMRNSYFVAQTCIEHQRVARHAIDKLPQLQTEISNLKSVNNTLKAQLKDRNAALCEREGKIVQLRRDKQGLEDCLDGLKKENAVQGKECTDLHDECRRLKHRQQSWKEDIAALQRQNGALEEEVRRTKSSQKEADRYMEEVARLRMELEQSQHLRDRQEHLLVKQIEGFNSRYAQLYSHVQQALEDSECNYNKSQGQLGQNSNEQRETRTQMQSLHVDVKENVCAAEASMPPGANELGKRRAVDSRRNTHLDSPPPSILTRKMEQPTFIINEKQRSNSELEAFADKITQLEHAFDEIVYAR